MSTKIADDSQSIAQRLKEIEAEKMQRIMGTPLEEAKEPEVVWSYMGEAAIGWPFTAYDISKA